VAGGSWRAVIHRAALGPGDTCLKLPDHTLSAARLILEQYTQDLQDEDVGLSQALRDPFQELQDFVDVHGRVPFAYERPDIEDWAAEQRSRRRRGDLAQEEVARLGALPGWAWYFAGGDNQQQGLQRLEEFREMCLALGTSYVPFDASLSDGKSVNVWLSERRRMFARNKMPLAIAMSFASLPHWTWSHSEWQEAVALRELAVVLSQTNTISCCLRSNALTPTTGRLARVWWSSNSGIGVPLALETLPGWSWKVSDDAHEVVEQTLLALALTRTPLTRRVYKKVVVRRMLSPAPEDLSRIGARVGISREATRQAESIVKSRVQHPLLIASVVRDLESVGAHAEVMSALLSDRHVAAKVLAIGPPRKPSYLHTARVLSAILGRPIPAAVFRPKVRRTVPCVSGTVGNQKAPKQRAAAARSPRYASGHPVASGVLVPSASTSVPPPPLPSSTLTTELADLGVSTRLRNLLMKHGMLSLADVASLDPKTVELWRGSGSKTVTELRDIQTRLSAESAS
jgi:hypothetical protein